MNWNKNLIPLIDSRKVISPEKSIFFAIKGQNNDGHNYIDTLYKSGVTEFIIEQESFPIEKYKNARFHKVNNTIESLQEFAKSYRDQFNIPVIGITGSNGKTMIKEWLSQLLNSKFNVTKSPRSYNSQVGVPLSIFEIKPYHNIALLEAGISTVGEMEKLENIIRPTIGIFTNIGSAHDEGFESREQKIEEKLKLFEHAKILIYRNDHSFLDKLIKVKPIKTLTWSLEGKSADIQFSYSDSKLSIHSDQIKKGELDLKKEVLGSLENICHCIATLIHLNYTFDEIKAETAHLHSISMRMEVKEGINNCILIDDTYNNDLFGLKTALELFSQNNQQTKRTIILSDLYQTGLNNDSLYKQVNTLLKAYNVNRLIGIGESINKYKFELPSVFYDNTNAFLKSTEIFESEVILVKGSRNFSFERIVEKLTQKQHRAYLDINLDALTSNLSFYRQQLNTDTKLMVMVKAFAYGNGSNEIANILQYNRVDYLAVAYADEGITLRQNGIHIPVMVMNPSKDDFSNMFKNQLEPEIYSLNLLNEWVSFAMNKQDTPKIHLKIDTGMRRLGFEKQHLTQLIKTINQHKLQIASIFSHLASADDNSEIDFTKRQIEIFNGIAKDIQQKTKQKPLLHILNSSGIIAHNHAQFDMVRLGIGLYGYDPSKNQMLANVASLYAQISQIKTIEKGETVGYGRSFKADTKMKIATVNIGYADGVSRLLSNGVGKVWVNHKFAPIVGNVCMDMIMIDISNINCKEGDQVEIFGKNNSILELANKTNTIPYEILTSISERVKRVYFKE